ncbi:hypothetical protein [Flexithrix dorotheae]|uniref:hypothetical protein n=1 Tax=Flexithrix dorotheae TaxID=70993 RepID=UPI00037035F1|nr:hypothetical protein [Flexithrix dorotheae]
MPPFLTSSYRLYLYSFLYLALPSLIFIFGWFRLAISLPALGIIGYSTFLFFKELTKFSNRDTFTLPPARSIKLLLISTGICLFSGIGGFTFQGDAEKHYSMLYDLVNQDWPVLYISDLILEKKAFLNYYFGYFLPPAFLAKTFNIHWIDDLILVWSILGLYLSFCWVLKLANAKHIGWAVLMLLFLGGQDFIYATLKLGLNHIFTDKPGIWEIYIAEVNTVCVFHNTILRYPTNFYAVSWAPQHLFGAWICTSLVTDQVIFRKNIRNIGFIAAFLPIWSVFNAIGLLPFLMVFIWKGFRKFLSFQNLAGGGILVFLVGTFFIAHYPVEDQGWIWEYIPFPQAMIKILLFLLFEFGYLALIMNGYAQKSPYKLIWQISLITLSVLPFYVLGYFNDLLMRAAVPSIFLINVVAVCFFYQWKFKYKKLATGLVLFMVAFPQLIAIGKHLPGTIMFHAAHGFSESRKRVNEGKSLLQVTDAEWFNYQYFGKSDSFYMKFLAKKQNLK